MHFLYSNVLVSNVNIKTLKNAPTCFDLNSDHPQGARSFLVKVTEFKITKNIKGPLWQCGSICCHIAIDFKTSGTENIRFALGALI